MTGTFYFDQDADLTLLDGKVVGVIGYGNQGRSQALNLRDSGVEVAVGNVEDDYAEQARADGWTVRSIAEASSAADFILILIHDEAQPAVFESEIRPHLKAGDLISFAHGYNIHFQQIVPPTNVDTVMLAPRMLGKGVRDTYLSGQGFPSFIAVHHDASSAAGARVLALAKGIGSTRMGVLQSSFEEETLIDLFEEHQPALFALRCMYEALVESGCSPEAVMLDLYASGESVTWAQGAVDLGAFERMKLASQTAQFGHLVWSQQFFDKEGTMKRYREMIDKIKSGEFARTWHGEKTRNAPQLDEIWKDNRAHEMMAAEDRLYQILGRRPKDS